MARKAILRITGWIARAFFVTLGVLAIAVFAGWVALYWRLSQGPLDASFLTDQLQRSIAARYPGIEASIGKTYLVWGGRYDPFEVEAHDIEVRRTDGTPVFGARKIGIFLSKRNLVLARVVPRTVRLYAPALKVMRWEDGHFSLNLSEPLAPQMGPPLPPAMQDAKTAGQVALVQALLEQMRDRSRFGTLLGGMREIVIENAQVVYEDKGFGTLWASEDTDISITKRRGGIAANARMALDVGSEHPAVLRASLSHLWETGKTGVVLFFSGIDIGRTAAASEKLADYTGVMLPIKGSVSFMLDENFKPDALRFVLGADPGTFSGFGLYPAEQPLTVEYLYAAGMMDLRQGHGRIDQLKIDLGGPAVEAKMSYDTDAEGVIGVTAEAVLTDMPMDDLHRYWPVPLAPDPRKWVTEQLSAGIADKATLKTDIAYAPHAAEGEEKITLRELGGVIDFHGIKVDYFPPLMPVLQAKGRAVYDHSAFDIAVASGTLGDMAVKKGRVRILDIDKQDEVNHAKIQVSADVSGPLRTALRVLDAEPLQYPKMLGIRSADAGGMTDVNVSIAFPIHHDLDLDEVDVSAKAKLDNASLPRLVNDMDVTGIQGDLSVDNGALSVKGRARLMDMPATFDWTKNFTPRAAFDSRVKAELSLSAAALEKFGVPAALKLSGTMPADVLYTVGQKGDGMLVLKGDLAPLGFRLDAIGFDKPAGVAGGADMTLHTQNDSLRRISGLALAAEGLRLRGDIDFTAGTDGSASLSRADLSSVVYGDSDVAVSAVRGTDGGYDVSLRGRSLDLSGLYGGGEKVPPTDAEMAKPVAPLRVTLDTQKLTLSKGRAIEQAKVRLHRNQWQRVEMIEADGSAGGQMLTLRYGPANGGKRLYFEAKNAGAALAALGVTQSVRGGGIVVKGEPSGAGRDMKGSVVLSDFTLKDAPVIARLLNAMSLGGVLNLLNGDGISFKRARADFAWQDRGQPAQAQNVRMVKLSDGRTSGASLGLTFEGDIDMWSERLDLNGTIVPVSDLNRLLSIIPLVGDVLTAGGEGLIGATYKVQGTHDAPEVSVNPLSALAPGILRKIFFEN